jgi:uncharacterized protein (DUF2147 family)
MSPLRRYCVLILGLAISTGWAAPADVEGRWLSGDGEGWIRVSIVGNSLIGVIAGSTKPKLGEPPRRDDKNPDRKLRDRLLDGMTIMQGFKYDGGDKWTGGTVYDPNTGNTYKCTLTQVDRDTLKIRGYIGISLFGRSDTWTRDPL